MIIMIIYMIIMIIMLFWCHVISGYLIIILFNDILMILNGAFGGNKHAHLHTHTWNITDYHWPSDHLCWYLEMILQMHPWQTRWQYLTMACKGLVMSSSMNPALAKWLEATPDSGLYTPSSPFSSTFTHFQHLSAYIYLYILYIWGLGKS